MEDQIDYGAGIWLDKKYGDAVKKGDVIARIYASDKKRLQEGVGLFSQAVKIQKAKPKTYPIVREIIK
jgi:pyrimidine-nucleoside phosphorylase